jgi:lipopolysaccharide export system permease protein
MLKQIDRLLVRGYFKAYLICLASLLSLYVVIDLFTNIDEFTHRRQGTLDAAWLIASYYGYKVSHIFDRLCEVIVLLAAMFTVAWMQRNNEVLPLLSAGVSTRRVVAPVLASACVMLTLAVANQEFVIPRIADRLMYDDKDDPHGEKDLEQLQGPFESNGVHVHGARAARRGMVVKGFCCTILPGSVSRNLTHLSAQEARYVPPGNGPRSGGWLLTGTQPAELEPWDNPKVLERLDPGKYFLHTSEIDFDALTRSRSWFQFVSTYELFEQLQKPDATRLASMAVLFHMRLTRPILGLILVFIGLSVILRDQNRNVFISAGLCLVLCALFFTACFASKQLGDGEYLAPALAAWLPVLVFGPLAFVMFDAVHTSGGAARSTF